MTQVRLSTRRRKKSTKGSSGGQSWTEGRPWTDASFKQARTHLRTRISKRHWEAKSYWSVPPFSGDPMVGFTNLTVTIDKTINWVCKDGFYSSDKILRRFSSFMEKLDIPGVCYFDIGANSNPHMHCMLAVNSREAYMRLMDSLTALRKKFGQHLEITRLSSDDDVGRWMTYSEKKRPWHGNFPADMQPTFARFRGMATSFSLDKLPEVITEKIQFDDVTTEVSVPSYVEGTRVTVPVTPVSVDLCGDSRDERLPFILEYARKGLPDMLGAAASLVKGSTAESFVRMDRLTDTWVVDKVVGEYASNPEKAARLLHNQLFEFRKERLYLAAQSARKIGADVYYIVNGDKVSPGLDRMLYSANLRIL